MCISKQAIGTFKALHRLCTAQQQRNIPARQRSLCSISTAASAQPVSRPKRRGDFPCQPVAAGHRTASAELSQQRAPPAAAEMPQYAGAPLRRSALIGSAVLALLAALLLLGVRALRTAHAAS